MKFANLLRNTDLKKKDSVTFCIHSLNGLSFHFSIHSARVLIPPIQLMEEPNGSFEDNPNECKLWRNSLHLTFLEFLKLNKHTK